MASIRYFAAAAEAAGAEAGTIPASTIGELRATLVETHGPEFQRVLGRCSLLVNGTRSSDDSSALSAEDTVDILPPFAGG